ncbi:gene transfer agent family protein [Pararhizobium qamdonense]|uniref:gene transfer agent family protein n=1 Tax=Pararhizobium qamdonense TaxID=3031126 RepID=UPI0023E2B3F1|nr:gene transfer agent family protein [Pararhizobium qamdonense]
MNELPVHRQFLGDAEYGFRLSPELILELERKTGTGIGSISKRFFAGEFGFLELTETIRLGLIGGGTDPQEAAALVTTYSARMSVTDLYTVALPVMDALMFGMRAKPKGRKVPK